MIQADTRAQIFEIVIDMLCFYIGFVYFLKWRPIWWKILVGLIYTPSFLIVFVFLYLNSSVIFGLLLYAVFTRKWLDWATLNRLLTAGIIVYIAAFFSNIASIQIFHFAFKGWGIVSFEVLVEIIVVGLLITLVDQPWFDKFLMSNLKLSTAIQLVLVFVFLGYVNLVFEFNEFDQQVMNTFIFVIVELVAAGIIFGILVRWKRARYKKDAEHQQLLNLQGYIQQLETSQSELRKFRHGYKNVVKQLSELSEQSHNLELTQYLTDLEEYSEAHLIQSVDAFSDIKNVHDTYLKDLFLTEFFAMQQSNRPFKFDCHQPLLPLGADAHGIVQLIRSVLEATVKETEQFSQSPIEVFILQNGHQLEIKITGKVEDGHQFSKSIEKDSVLARVQQQNINTSVTYKGTAQQFSYSVRLD